MSKGRKPKNSGGNLVEMEPDTPDAEPIEPDAEPITEARPAPEPADAEEPPPAVVDPDRGRRKTLTLFDRVRQIPKADWGTRAFIYVYCLEPICDLKMGGEKKYLVKSKQPIYDEDSIMMDYGSGKYRLQLVYRKPAADKSDQIDACEIEIYNPKYPPKIPQSVWMNDPRNARWLALIPPKEEPKPDTPMGTIADTFKVFSDMRKDVREELKPAIEANQARPRDPFEIAQAIVNMKTGEDSSTVKLFEKQIDIMDRQNQAAQTRIDNLEKEMRDQLRAQSAPAAEKSDPIDTLVKAADKLEPLITRFMPKVTEAAGQVIHGRRPQWWETMLENAAPAFMEVLKPIGVALAMKMAAGSPPVNGGYVTAPQPTAAPGIAGPPQPAPAQPGQPPQPPKLITFLSQPIVMGAFQSYFKSFVANANDNNGGDFAQWIFDAVGEGPLVDARAMGTPAILNLFKAAPQWPMMHPHEAKLTEFLDQALAWKPDALIPDDEDETTTDLTAM